MNLKPTHEMIFYKYYPPNENSLKSLVNSGLWCDNYTNMNDPFESLAVVQRKFEPNEIEEFRKHARKSEERENNLMAELEDKAISEFINEIRNDILKNAYYFASLSDTYTNILLWSHYCSSHTGFVIAIELDENDSHIQKVTYSDSLPSFDMSWFFKLKDDDRKDSPQVNYLLKDLAIKSNHWAYEEEWRLNRSKKGYKIYQPEQLKAIYFGLNTNPEIERIVLFLASVFKQNLPVYKMKFEKDPLGLSAVDYELPKQ